MRQAIALALKAQFKTAPNPLVGAILTDRQGKILSQGYHRKSGLPHAEVEALGNYKSVPEDSVLFVTLEPCAHFGKTPPCADLILEKKVKKVIIGQRDPNPKVNGKGIQRLLDAGIEVLSGVCQKECEAINPVYIKNVTRNLPYVSIKSAISLDGKIATASGESKWITGPQARERGHLLRSQHQSIAVGKNTLEADDPRLDNRAEPKADQPVRVVFASSGDISEQSHYFKSALSPRILFGGPEISKDKINQLESNGIDIIQSETPMPGIEWALRKLHEKGISSLLVEGGSRLVASFLKEKMADRLYLFMAPKIIGSQKALGWTGELGFTSLEEAFAFRFENFEQIGDDLLITAVI